MTNPETSEAGVETEQPMPAAGRGEVPDSLTDNKKAAIDCFLFERYKLSALGLAVVAFALGFFVQDLAIQKATGDAQKAAWEQSRELEEYLREQENNYEAKRLQVQWLWERLAAVEAEVHQAFETADLPSSTRAALMAAGGTPMKPQLTPFGPLSQGSTNLGPHDLCFLVTMDLDANKKQACVVKQDGDNWVAQVQGTSCQVVCLDY